MFKGKACVACLILAAVSLMSSVAFGGDLDISGFFDVTSSYHDSQGDSQEFGLGQAEINVESQLSPVATVAVAVAYNSEESIFELGAAELGLTLMTNEASFVTSLELVAGQFYVPFGIDYQVYPSIDRKLVTVPMVVDLTHGGWNDLGLKFNATSSAGNLVVFGVNGFESSYEVADQAHSLSLGVAVGEEVNTTPANAFGARIGLTPAENLEIGGSFAVGMNESSEDEMTLAGADVQFTLQNLDFKGEYITHSLNRSIDTEENAGYYVQSVYNFERAFLVGRYGAFQPDGGDWVGRYSLGAGYAVTDGVELRFETTINDNSDNNSNILQLVAAF